MKSFQKEKSGEERCVSEMCIFDLLFGANCDTLQLLDDDDDDHTP